MSELLAGLVPVGTKTKHPKMLIRHYYPIHGHSYLPVNWLFGRIEHDLCKLETILLQDYHAVMSKHGTVRILGDDWNVLDYKSAVSTMVKKKLPFLLSKARIIQVTESNIGMKATYFW